ncbi:MAG: tetratricopeptide repeat protein [Bacteroidales bacterium]
MGVTYNNLGMNFQNLGQYDKAIEQYQNSYSIAREIGNETHLFFSLINIGIVYDEWGKYSFALEHYKRALAISRAIQSQSYMGISLQNIGYVLYETKQYDSALLYFEKSLEISDEIGDKTGIFNTLINKGEVYIELYRYDSAIENFEQALQIAEESGNSNNIILASLKLGEAHRLNGQLSQSKPLLELSLSNARQMEEPKLIKDALLALSEFYSSSGDFRNAYSCFQEYTSIKDTIFNRDSRHEITEMQTLYELDKKEAEIEIQNLRIEQQRNRIYFILLSVIVLIVLAYLVFNRYKLKQKHYRIELEKKNIDIEQRLLRTQMNPHFIFNSLNSINSFISDNDSGSAQSYLSKFASLMRYILDNSRKTMVPVEDEINTLKLNMELERTSIR